MLSVRNASLSGVAAAVALIVALSISGCTGGGATGSLRANSLTNNPVQLPGSFVAAYYSHDAVNGTSFMLSSVPPDELMKGDIKNGQILHIDLLWVPLAGETPMDPTATNASIRYIIVSNGEVGIYGGAGFALPAGAVTDDSLRMSLEDASLQLLEKTSGFRDLLGPAQLTGSFNALRDDTKTRQLNYATSQLVTNALGRTRFVMSAPPASPLFAIRKPM